MRKLSLVACVKEHEEPEVVCVIFMFVVLWMWGFPTPRLRGREVGTVCTHWEWQHFLAAPLCHLGRHGIHICLVQSSM